MLTVTAKFGVFMYVIKYINSLRICDIVHYFNQNSVENQQKIMASYDDFHG